MYAINEFSKTPIFQINQHIGYDRDITENGEITLKGDGQGIDGKVFANEVLSFNNSDVDKLVFYINSQGGDVQQSLDMFNAISMSAIKTHSIITGFAFSCAGWIPMAADKVDMVSETGKWMCHMPYNPDNPDEQSQFMDEVVDIISKTISAKSGRNGKDKKTPDDIKKLMKEKTYWSAERMHDEGLIDNIVNSKGKVVKLEKDPILLNKTELNYYYKEYQVAQNKFVADTEKNTISQQNHNKMSYLKAVNRFNAISKEKTGIQFNLTDDSSEETIIDAIAKLENRLRAMNDDMMDKETAIVSNKKMLDEKQKEVETKEKEAMDARKALDKMKEDMDFLTKASDAMKNEMEELINKEKATALSIKKERATNLIEKAIAEKKISATESMTIDEVKEIMINKATENYSDIELQLSLVKGIFAAPKHKLKNQLPSGAIVDQTIIEKMKTDNIQRVRDSQVRIENGVKIRLYDNKVVAQ